MDYADAMELWNRMCEEKIGVVNGRTQRRITAFGNFILGRGLSTIMHEPAWDGKSELITVYKDEADFLRELANLIEQVQG